MTDLIKRLESATRATGSIWLGDLMLYPVKKPLAHLKRHLQAEPNRFEDLRIRDYGVCIYGEDKGLIHIEIESENNNCRDLHYDFYFKA